MADIRMFTYAQEIDLHYLYFQTPTLDKDQGKAVVIRTPIVTSQNDLGQNYLDIFVSGR